MAKSLLISSFLSKIPQNLKKFCDVGDSGLRLYSRAVSSQPKKDRFIEKAKKQKYRSRSALKLIEFDQKYDLLKPGFKVLDIGAAPGSWSQYLACRTNSNREDPNSPAGLVIAVDTENFDDIEGVITLSNTDFLKQSSQNKILGYLGQGQKFDFILSDMVTETGVDTFDKERLMKLVYCVMLFSVKNLKPGGGVLLKVCGKGERHGFQSDMKKFFESVKFDGFIGPHMNFSESYFIGRNFLGLKK